MFFPKPNPLLGSVHDALQELRSERLVIGEMLEGVCCFFCCEIAPDSIFQQFYMT